MSALLALLAQAATFASTPAAPPFAAESVPDEILATQRGGIRLPNGIDLNLAVQTQTAVNGAVVLQTVFALDKGPATFTIYAPSNGSVVPAQSAGSSMVSSGSTTPTVTYDPRTGLTVTQAHSGMPVTIGGSAPAGGDGIPEGLVALDPALRHETAAGSVSSRSDGLLKTVTLTGADFSVAHLAGAAFGSAIANSGSNRAIDTITSISIDLQNAGPDVLGSVFFRVENVALGALGSRL